jgi:hypothetical protein
MMDIHRVVDRLDSGVVSRCSAPADAILCGLSHHEHWLQHWSLAVKHLGLVVVYGDESNAFLESGQRRQNVMGIFWQGGR